MKKSFTFQGMDSSPALEAYVNDHIHRIERLLEKEPQPVTLECKFHAGRTHHHHRFEIILKSSHYNLVAHDEGPDVYPVIIRVIDKLFGEITRAKEKRIDARERDPRP